MPKFEAVPSQTWNSSCPSVRNLAWRNLLMGIGVVEAKVMELIVEYTNDSVAVPFPREGFVADLPLFIGLWGVCQRWFYRCSIRFVFSGRQNVERSRLLLRSKYTGDQSSNTTMKALFHRKYLELLSKSHVRDRTLDLDFYLRSLAGSELWCLIFTF